MLLINLFLNFINQKCLFSTNFFFETRVLYKQSGEAYNRIFRNVFMTVTSGRFQTMLQSQL